ncbi:hypothetical protein [Rhodococcus qingshengii]|uniref:hypothetical protein n=1 Tax=Rhodococcus qingshengii TaxID=334542 RepID=UPI0018DA51DF|nr:hypothetical protein [Rhodococcus qingshengii]QPG90951.1 hypothetical protein I1G86_06735 [Rhodococcus qingshengii]
MSYGTVLESDFFDRPGILKLMQTPEGVRAILALLELRTYSANAKSDGVIPIYALRKATTHSDPDSALALLHSVGESEQLDDDEWFINWEGQKTADERSALQVKWKISKRHQRGDHADCPTTWKCRKSMSAKVSYEDKGEESSQDSPAFKVRKGNKNLSLPGTPATSPAGAVAASTPESAVTEPSSDIEHPVVVERDEIITPRYFKGEREFNVEFEFETVNHVLGTFPDGRQDIHYGARVELWRSEGQSTDDEWGLLKDAGERALKLDREKGPYVVNSWQGRYDGDEYDELSGNMTWIESDREDRDATVELMLTALDQVLTEDGWDKDSVSDRLVATQDA